MYIIVGLGNPGKKYENTHHNMGFITIDQIAGKYDINVNKLKFKALVGEGRIAGQKVLLVKPQTYMNLSGQSVREIMNFYKEPMENLIVIYDDIDIALGTFRIRAKGSAGTHNGMRDIVYQLNDDSFPRIRIGIGGERKGDLVDFVIGNVSKSEKEPLEAAITKVVDAVACYIEEGIDICMNKYNVRPKKEKKRKDKEITEENTEKVNKESDD